MPTVHVPVQLDVEHLLAAVKQLSPLELHSFKQQLAVWEAQHDTQADEETTLLQATKARLPVVDQKRLNQLIAKSERGSLLPKEHNEYRTLAQRAEQIDVIRAEALAEIVRRRHQPVRVVMQNIGWERAEDGS